MENGRLHQLGDRRPARVRHRNRRTQIAADPHPLGAGGRRVLTHPQIVRMSLTPAQARQVDDACDAFEMAWRSGQRPRIEEHLGEAPGPVQTVLLDELLKLDMAYRRRSGERPML